MTLFNKQRSFFTGTGEKMTLWEALEQNPDALQARRRESDSKTAVPPNTLHDSSEKEKQDSPPDHQGESSPLES